MTDFDPVARTKSADLLSMRESDGFQTHAKKWLLEKIDDAQKEVLYELAHRPESVTAKQCIKLSARAGVLVEFLDWIDSEIKRGEPND